jgi:tRNA dimethylallyltransferase
MANSPKARPLPKVLIISGPTATGKTAIAAKLAQKLNGELISADSRQIYQGLDIGTGKDHPQNTPIHLIDIVSPSASFSVAQYRLLALKKIKEIHARHHLPIIVGGTGQYLESLISPQSTFSIPPKHLLRLILNRLPVIWLQHLLRLINRQLYRQLNQSDVHNPHRLIRKIEISLSPPKTIYQDSLSDYFHLHLTAPNSFIFKQIDRRISSRLKAGLLDEIASLLQTYSWRHPGLNTLSYKEFQSYFSSPSPSRLQQSLLKWKHDEHAYARRQKTFFHRLHFDVVFDVSAKTPQAIVNQIIKMLQ